MKNSTFQKKFAGKTRSTTLKMGNCIVGSISIASNNKIMSSELLASSILSAAICKHFRKPNSRLNLLEEPDLRNGLVEILAWQCNQCKHKTIFKTRKRCISSQKKTTAYETNVRSVYASQTLGRAGLVNLCNLMDLPSPINKTPYQSIQNELDSVLTNKVEEEMKDAASKVLTILWKINHSVLN